MRNTKPLEKKEIRQMVRRIVSQFRPERIILFGPYARGDAGPDSDVDLLVEFFPGKEPGLLGLATIEMELSSLLGGRCVDLRTPQDLSRHFRDEVVRAAEVQYAA